MSLVKSFSHEHHVYIVDDDVAMRRALIRGLEPLGYDVHQFASAAEFLGQAYIFGPSVLVVDMRMPEISGVELQAMLLDKGWKTPLIFISGESSVQQGIIAMKQGAWDFLVKPFDLDRLLSAIEAAIEFDCRQLQTLTRQQATRRKLEVLKPREREAYQCLAKGYSYAEMMQVLDISLPTAKQYRAAVMRKLKFGTLADLLKFDKDLNAS
jgi:two-component system response regulator FixJ